MCPSVFAVGSTMAALGGACEIITGLAANFTCLGTPFLFGVLFCALFAVSLVVDVVDIFIGDRSIGIEIVFTDYNNVNTNSLLQNPAKYFFVTNCDKLDLYL